MEKTMSAQFAPGELASIYYWMGIIRFIGAPVIGGAIFLLWRLGAFDFNPFFILSAILPVYFCFAFLIWMAVRVYTINSPLLLYGELLADFLAITASIYLSGGTHIEFIFLYMITIVPATLISFRAALGVALLSILASTAFIISPRLDVVSAFYEPRFGLDNGEIIIASIFILLTVIVAFQGYMYISRIKKVDREILRIKDEFLFRTVHDLRSPFTTIRWIVDKYSLPEYRLQYPDLTSDIATMSSINERVLRILQDLSEVAKGEQAGLVLKKENVVLPVLVRSILREKTNAINARHISVTYAPPKHLAHVLADEQAVKEVLSNIIDNAIAYNKDGGEISVFHPESTASVITTVQDTGRGIAQKDIEKLFQPYVRGSSSAGVQGSGLGLYLVKKLIEKMNGKVAIASQEGRGTTVTISLPIV